MPTYDLVVDSVSCFVQNGKSVLSILKELQYIVRYNELGKVLAVYIHVGDVV
jgi:hypothetical protein